MVLPQESSEPIGQGGAPAPAVHDPVPMQAPAPDTVRDPVPEPVVEPEPEPMPEPDLAQQIVVAVNALRDARLTHDDAPTRQRKADTAVADVEVQRDPCHVRTTDRPWNSRKHRTVATCCPPTIRPDHCRTGRAGCLPRRVVQDMRWLWRLLRIPVCETLGVPHDYPVKNGGDGTPAHFYTYTCWACGEKFGI